LYRTFALLLPQSPSVGFSFSLEKDQNTSSIMRDNPIFGRFADVFDATSGQALTPPGSTLAAALIINMGLFDRKPL
jgi:hypothetical protein